MRFAQRVRPSAPDPDLTSAVGPTGPNPKPRRGNQLDQAKAIRDEWSVLAAASTDGAPRALAAAQDAVFRRYLPIAHAVAGHPVPGDRQIDPIDAVQAAEIGLAQAMLGWRRPDSAGFEFFAQIVIAARLDRLPTAPPP